jgi:aldehyde:ferredoxin oxidoreductase
MDGYGSVLRVNLSTGIVTQEPFALQDVIQMGGGRGFGIRYLYNEVSPLIDPLGEENKVLLLTGVLAGTSVVAASRWLAVSLSPLTGCYGKSCAGGDFGAWMKFSGNDLIILEGKAESPVYLSISPQSSEIRAAGELWGKNTGETQTMLKEMHGKNARIACIGPAGENLIKYAAIVTGTRTASRCGIGTVMGSKNIKAVVINGKKRLNLHDPSGLKQLAEDQFTGIQENPVYLQHKQYGTTGGSISRNVLGVFPTRNFRYGQMEGYELLSEDEYMKLRIGEFGCYACPARCGKIHHVPADRLYGGSQSEGPEYESYWSFSGPIDSTSIEASVAADQLCDELGLDTISTGGTIGFAYELYERGILSRSDTDGLELKYGNHSSMIALIKKIAIREGFGDVLAEGTLRAARRIGRGAEAYAMQVKGLELAGYEPRGLKSTGFGYATSTIGGSHGNGSLAFQEWGMPVPRAVDRFTEDDKADIVIFNQTQSAFTEVGVLCAFSRAWGDWLSRLYGQMLVAATGIKEFGDMQYMIEVGDRIVNLERAYNVRAGFDRRQDTLPERFLTEPLHTGEAEGEGEIVRNLEQFLDEYYSLRGWTSNGIPSIEKLEHLGLNNEIKDMKSYLNR